MTDISAAIAREKSRNTRPYVQHAPHVTAVSPRDFASRLAYGADNREGIARWAAHGAAPSCRPGPDVRSRYHDVRAARETIAAALDSLGDRAGERAEAARAYLNGELACIDRSLRAFERLVIDPTAQWPELGGEYVESWEGRYQAALETLAQARAAQSIASVDRVIQARDDVLLAGAFVGDLERELQEAVREAALPAYDVSAIEAAKQATADLTSAARDRRRLKATRNVIDQGLSASSLEALLWVCFEAADAKGRLAEFVELRWSAHVEASRA